MLLDYQRYGEASNCIVILHGLLGSLKNWTTIAKELSEEYCVLVPSMRNHGFSPHGSHSIEFMRQDIYELLEYEQIDKILLVGHSMGGLVAMSFATVFPERLIGLIVVDIVPEVQLSKNSPIFDALLSLDLNTLSSKQEASELLQNRIADQTTRQFLLQNLVREDNNNLKWLCNLNELKLFAESEDGFSLGVTQKYTGPSLFIGGAKSEYKIDSKEELIKHHFPNARIQLIPGAGHWVHFEAKDAFLNIVKQFINKYC